MKTKGFERKRRIIVGVSGASGAIYAYRLIQVLADSGIEVHFVASKAGLEVLEYECGLTMVQLTQMVHKIYPQYGFAKNKGYGTSEHLEALRKYGPCEIHRKSFEPIKSMVMQK